MARDRDARIADIGPAPVSVAIEVAGRHDVPPASLSAELQNLQQLYALLTDEGRATELVALFTPDAVWDGRELNYGMVTGAETIAQHVVAHFDADQPMMHLPGPLLLARMTDDEVESVSWCMATRWVAGKTKPVIYFYYHDRFQRDEGGIWRYAERVLKLRFR